MSRHAQVYDVFSMGKKNNGASWLTQSSIKRKPQQNLLKLPT